jgi:two-component system sensor kinase FixL
MNPGDGDARAALQGGPLGALMMRQASGYTVVLLDPQGVIVDVNDAIGVVGYWPPEQVRGRSHELFYPPDGIAEGRPAADLSDAARDGLLERDAWRVCHDGSEYLARLAINPLRDEGGVLRGFGCIVRDITEDAAVRASIEAREQHLQSILATVPDAMIIIDERGTITSFSAAAERLFGYVESELLGRNVSCLMPEPDRGRHDQYISHYLETGERRVIGMGRVVVGQRRDGTTFPMELSVGQAGEDGSRIFTGFIRDLTAKERDELRLKELQAELVHVSRLSAMGTMASTLAHELNQPLTAVANYLETTRDLLAEDGEIDRAMLREALAEAATETLRAGYIVRRLRDFVSRGDIDKSIEDLPQLIDEAGKLALVGAREWGVRTVFRFDPEATPTLVDRVQIQQVLVNLMRNALEAMAASDRRELTVSTSLRPDGAIEVSVEDTGPGISDEIVPRLFQAFVSSKAEGMGLGLSICRTIIEAHGGRIWADALPGGGTAFRFTLIHARTDEENEG